MELQGTMVQAAFLNGRARERWRRPKRKKNSSVMDDHRGTKPFSPAVMSVDQAVMAIDQAVAKRREGKKKNRRWLIVQAMAKHREGERDESSIVATDDVKRRRQ
ncbi:hypothetical protein L6452_19424 [Arctium lappa]|uniref:Uncharacterized protein n=1 Tax=Arctium lappa TaxID=4217 RepID=A0ACB9B7Z4_ARCLA|nr:hypothetical protein L6452_19424 [Arctium lappa]